ncbi:MAG: hypothetical protein RBR10_11410 [Bacteroidales bacterium]|nr:hypothetical protein [Bacteroidales bacterium]MDY0370433.1 hypothetical protein [Bacteroidales bacterium]
MKTTFFQFFAILTLASLLMQGCHKEPQSAEPISQSDETVYTLKAAQLVADINKFKQKLTTMHKNPTLKSGEVMGTEEACWNIETLFNVTYGFPDLNYSKTITDTALVYLPVDASGNALLEDVVTLYEEILGIITNFYLATNFDEKGFLFMQLKTGEMINGQLEILVRSVTGEQRSTPTEPQEWNPFEDNEEWWYGELYGKCDHDPLYFGTDAAKKIEFYLNTKRPLPPSPPTGFRYIYVDHEDILKYGHEYIDNEGNYLIFFIEREDGNFSHDEKCLNNEELNFHYHGQRKVIYNIIPEEMNKPNNWKFVNCELTGELTSITLQDISYCIRHKNKLTYAYRYLVPVSEIPLPVEL